MKTVVIGAGSELGVQINGASLGPIQLIKDMMSFYSGEIISIKQNSKIIKNRNLAEKRKNEQEVNVYNNELYKIIVEKIRESKIPITIGGDHSISIATVLGSAREYNNIGLLWFDSHTDYNTYETTPTGNIHGMALAAINGYKLDELRLFHLGNLVNPFKTVVVGARSIDQRERGNVKYTNLNVFTSKDIKERSAKAITEEAFKIAAVKTQKIHISFDLDLIDPEVAPGVSVPADNGISEVEAMEIIDVIINNIDKISAIDIVEFNPLRDPARKTEQIALNILAKLVTAIDKNFED